MNPPSPDEVSYGDNALPKAKPLELLTSSVLYVDIKIINLPETVRHPLSKT